MKSVGEYPLPEASVNSVNSVGGYFPTVVYVGSANSVGGLAEGGVGMAGMPYPPTIARLVQQGLLHPLLCRCKKCIDFFVVTKFRCIFAM